MPALVSHDITYHENGTATVRIISRFTGVLHTATLPLTRADYERWRDGGGHIQHILPHLSPSQREFLLTGSTPAEWDAAFGPND